MLLVQLANVVMYILASLTRLLSAKFVATHKVHAILLNIVMENRNFVQLIAADSMVDHVFRMEYVSMAFVPVEDHSVNYSGVQRPSLHQQFVINSIRMELWVGIVASIISLGSQYLVILRTYFVVDCIVLRHTIHHSNFLLES